MSMIKIPLIKSSKILDVQFYTGSIRTADLLANCEAPHFEAGKTIEHGYQRLPKTKRVSDISERVLKDPTSMDSFITSVTLNIRVPDAENYIGGHNTGHSTFEFIEKLGPFYLVDGQTRVYGIQLARNMAAAQNDSETVNAIDNSRLSITLSFTNDVYKEAYFFYLINQYAKAIPPEGAMRMIYDGYMNNETQFVNEVTSSSSRVTKDDILAMKVAELLKSHSSIWSSRIKDFNDKGEAGQMTIRAVAMKICRPLALRVENDLKVIGDHKKTPEKLTYDITEAYWVAISKIFPEMFDRKTAMNYGITKSSQSEVMSRVLKYIYMAKNTKWENSGFQMGDLTKPNTWVKLLKGPLQNFKDTSGAARKVKGHECWLVGKAGSMGLYTNSAAKKSISEQLVAEIERSIGISSIEV